MRLNLLKGLPLLLMAVACNRPQPSAKPDFLAVNIDTTVSPGEDFFAFANGGWIKRTPIPDAESGWGLGNLVQEEIYNRLKKVNEDALQQQAAAGTITQKTGDFWYSAMDSADIEKQGLAPLDPELQAVRAIGSKEDLAKVCADFHLRGIRVLFSDYVAQDPKNSDKMALGLNQGGLGMPNRDYYFNTDARTAAVRKAYQHYLFETFKELGADSVAATTKCKAVFDLETKLAKASRKLADLRDPYKNYHKMDMAALKRLAPAFDWAAYLKAVGAAGTLDSVIVGQPEFFTQLNDQLMKASLES